MEQLKFALGPYEVFASIVGGSPLVLAIFMIYNPSDNLQDIFLLITNNLSIPVVFLIGFFSYMLGGSAQGITWKYFLFLCNWLRLDYSYLGPVIIERNTQLARLDQAPEPGSLEFEDKLVLMLQEKVGIPKKIAWLDSRLAAYLKERGSQAVITAESYQANHIMYRNISFGCLLLLGVLLINLVRTQAFDFEDVALMIMFLTISYVTFFRSVSFKKWHNRELLLGFYFSARNEGCDE